MTVLKIRKDTTLRYPRVYQLLINSGHTPFRSLEIVLDAKRGKPFALRWIKLLHRARHRSVI